MHPAIIVGSLAGAAGVVALRMREASRPVTPARIVIPPIGMSTGFAMFAVPQTHVPISWAVAAIALGAAAFAYPLVKTSRLTVRGGDVFVERSKAFLWILLGLVAVRFALRDWVETYLGFLQTGALFFLLAFGMVVRWRVQMWLEYRRLRAGV